MNRNFILLSTLFRGVWLMDMENAVGYMPLIAKVLKGEPLEGEANPDPLPVAVSAIDGDRQYHSSWEEAPEGSTALIRVSGALMKSDFCFSPGTATLRSQLQAADRHPNISSHILIIDSPGGQVDGTKALADAIKAAAKPVVAYVDGLAASAAYWISSAADEIIVSTDTAIIGSIGTMISMKDVRGYYEQQGIKFHDIFASDSSEKNRVYLEALDGNYKPIQEQMLNPMNDIFLAAVRENRAEISEKALKGRTYLAADAIKMGLADHIGDFEFALQRLEALKGSNQSNHNIQSVEMFGKNKFTALTAALTAVASLKENEEMTEDHVDAINAELEKLSLSSLTVVPGAQLEQYNEELAQVQAQLATANEAVATLTSERDKFQQLAEEYGAKAGEEHTDLGNGEGDRYEDPNQSLIDSLPHNQELDNNPNFNNHKPQE